MVTENAAAEAAGEARAQRAPPAASGLVRLVTSHTRPVCEEDSLRNGYRRSLRLFKSLSCAGDLLKDHKDAFGRGFTRLFLTLTYRSDVDWAPKQISGLIKCMKQHCVRRGFRLRFVWVAEQHESGRVHYHAILWVPKGFKFPKPDEAGWWPHGSTKIEFARKGVGYLMKYASKTRDIQRPWPKHCRLHGHGGLTLCERVRRAWWVLPRYIREHALPEMQVRRAKGGGWISPISGEWWPAWSGPFIPQVADWEYSKHAY